MGYLDNSTITVDAILTKLGREALAKGRDQFRISQFALADDEVDYALWNSAHPLGSAYYGAVIENMPVTEAIPDETNTMKYMLITMPRTQQYMPYPESNQNAINIETEANGDTSDAGEVSLTIYTSYWGLTGQNANLNPKRDTGPFNKEAGYTITLLDNTYIGMNLGQLPDPNRGGGANTDTEQVPGTQIITNQSSPVTSVTVQARPIGGPGAANSRITIHLFTDNVGGFNTLEVGTVKSTKLIIRGNETGGRLVIPVTATRV